EERVLRHVADIRILPIARPAAGLRFSAVAELGESLGEGVIDDREVLAELKIFAEIVAGKHKRTAGVLLFALPEQVGGETDLGLHVLFAVTEIIVGNQRDDDAAGVARREL